MIEVEQDLMVSERKKKPFRWHVLVFLAPAVIVYTMIMILPLAETPRY